MEGCLYIVILSFVVVWSYSAQGQNITTTPTTDINQCGQSNPSGVQKRVVSGHAALPGAWPWQALVLYGVGRSFLCSGALIHPSWVLTAAHCIRNKTPRMYSIRLGDFDRLRYEGREQTIEVERVIPHPRHDYPVNRNNDLALIKLKTPAKLTRWVGTVCLPTEDDRLHQDLRCYATGWGLTKRSYSYSRKLQQAHIPLVTKYKCRMRANRWYRYRYWHTRVQEITNEMLCGGDDTTGASTCMGDSGGPYVCRNPEGDWVLQGITSWGSRSCLVSQRYSVFTKIRMFTSWIEEEMKSKPPVANETASPEDTQNTTRAKQNIAFLERLRLWLQRLLRKGSLD